MRRPAPLRARILGDSEYATLVDSATVEYAMTEGVELRWKDCKHIMQAQLVLQWTRYCSVPSLWKRWIECLKSRHDDKLLRLLKSIRKSR